MFNVKQRIKYNAKKKILKNYFRLYLFYVCSKLVRINLLNRKWQVHIFNHKIKANKTEENRIS